MFTAHFALEIVTDVRQRFARDGQNLHVADVDQVQLRGDPAGVVRRITQRRRQQDGAEQGRFDRKGNGLGDAKQFRIFLFRRGLRNAQRFVGEQGADPHALRPGADAFAIRTAIVRGHHPALGAVHEHPGAASFFLEPVAQRSDQIGAENPSG